MDFYSAFNPAATIAAPTGDGKEVEYALRTNPKTGVKDLVEVGVKDVYGMIQAAKDETLIENILERFKNGDASAIGVVSDSAFIDITEMPESLADAQNRLLVARDMFDALPVDVRAKYGHDFGQFLAEANNKPANVLTDLGYKIPEQEPVQPVTPVVEPVVTSNEAPVVIQQQSPIQYQGGLTNV